MPSTTGSSNAAVNRSDSPPLSGSSGAAALGGAVGGSIVGLLVGVVIIVLCVVLVLRKRRAKDRDRKAMENVGYEGGKVYIMEPDSLILLRQWFVTMQYVVWT